VKPGNIMLHLNSRVKIADFGIAKMLATSQRTQTGLVMGTPSYMSPEQIKAMSLDGRSDQFSLAVIAFEMLVGQKPFSGDSLVTLVHQIVYEEPRSLRELSPQLGAEVETAIRKALSKNPGDRYQTCTQFVRALRTSLEKVPEIEAVVPRPETPSSPGWYVWGAALALSCICFGAGYTVGRVSGRVPPGVVEKEPAVVSKPAAPNPPKSRESGTARNSAALPVDLNAHLQKGGQLLSNGMYDAAIAEYDAVLKARPGDKTALLGRASALKAKETEANVLK
jgi:serine/threonine protein kinase